ncbi:hypothetical protein L1887_34253 [Cichorium endivia]|nr:hypothetical protein L1887_34253 [Cichorium endivia]
MKEMKLKANTNPSSLIDWFFNINFNSTTGTHTIKLPYLRHCLVYQVLKINLSPIVAFLHEAVKKASFPPTHGKPVSLIDLKDRLRLQSERFLLTCLNSQSERSFEVANMISKTFHLHKSLKDSEISKLKNKILKSDGVKTLVSSDENYILDLELSKS